jgi:hypothetical protein
VCEAMRRDPKEATQTCGALGGVRMSHQINQSTDVLEFLIAQFHSLIHSLCAPEAVLLLDSLSCIRRLFCIQRICRFGFTRKLVKPNPRLSRSTIRDSPVFICLDMGSSEDHNFAVSRAAGCTDPESIETEFGFCLLAVDYCQAVTHYSLLRPVTCRTMDNK